MPTMMPRTQYAKSSDVSIAYQVHGEGSVDLVFVQGWLSNLETAWDSPHYARFLNRLASFSRLIRFDRRGMGLSDRDVGNSTLEERADDIRIVMQATGSKRAFILAVSEGGYMASMFAATYPERVMGLIYCGCFAKGARGADYLWGSTAEQIEANIAYRQDTWGEPFDLEGGAPSVAHDELCRRWFGSYLRSAASPGAAAVLSRLHLQIDVRSILPSVTAPTLVLHRTGDRWVGVEEGRYLAERIPGARFVELAGDDHIPFWGDQEPLLGEIAEFVTGTRHSTPTERVLLTVLVTDIIGSTERAAALGDARWKDLLGVHDAAVRSHLPRFEGVEINTTGDGFIMSFTGPTRGVQCARAIRSELQSLGLPIRAGLHTGECERRGRDLSGLAVHIAARTAQLATEAGILVSSTVKDLVVGSGLKFESVGSHSLKGVPGDWQLYRVLD